MALKTYNPVTSAQRQLVAHDQLRATAHEEPHHRRGRQRDEHREHRIRCRA